MKQIVPQCDSIEVAPFVLDILFFYCWWCYNKSQSILFPDGIVRFDVESDFLNKQTILENRILLLGANLPPLRFVLCYTNVVTLFMFEVILNATKFSIFRFQVFCTKGQLISKGHFVFFNSPKKQTKNFCPSRLGQKL